MSETKIKNSRGLMRRVYGLSPSVEEAIERFASTSEDNRLTVEEAKRLIKGQGYVRTKSRVYKLADLKDGKALVWRGYELACIREKSILKKAGSVAELCDEYVVRYAKRSGGRSFVSRCGDPKKVAMLHHIEDCDICGAIWTEKGLIIVAKMNKEGDLELL